MFHHVEARDDHGTRFSAFMGSIGGWFAGYWAAKQLPFAEVAESIVTACIFAACIEYGRRKLNGYLDARLTRQRAIVTYASSIFGATFGYWAGVRFLVAGHAEMFSFFIAFFVLNELLIRIFRGK